MPTFVISYLLGALTAPLVGRIIKPILRGTVKTTIGMGLEMKKLAAEAAEDVQDLAAEVSAGMVADSAAKTATSAETTAVSAEMAAKTEHARGVGASRRGGTV